MKLDMQPQPFAEGELEWTDVQRRENENGQKDKNYL